MGLARPGSALLSRSAGLARARHHRRDPHPARTKEKTAHWLRAGLRRAGGGRSPSSSGFLQLIIAVPRTGRHHAPPHKGFPATADIGRPRPLTSPPRPPPRLAAKVRSEGRPMQMRAGAATTILA